MSLKQKKRNLKSSKARRRRYNAMHAEKAYRKPDRRVSQHYEKMFWDSSANGTLHYGVTALPKELDKSITESV